MTNKFWQVKLMYKINCENIGDVKKYVWHYRKENREYGPFTYSDIIEMVRKGEIGPDDYVLKFGNKKFVRAHEIQGLLDVIPQPEGDLEEQMEIPEEAAAERDMEIKEELHVAFENSVTYIQNKHKKESSNQRIPMIIAGLLGLSLVAWLLQRIL